MLELIRRRPGLGLDDWPDQRLRALQRVIKNNVAVSRGRTSPAACTARCCSSRPPATRRRLAEKLDGWRPYVDGPIEAVELDCDHRYMLLPGPVTRLGAALSDRLARLAET